MRTVAVALADSRQLSKLDPRNASPATRMRGCLLSSSIAGRPVAPAPALSGLSTPLPLPSCSFLVTCEMLWASIAMLVLKFNAFSRQGSHAHRQRCSSTSSS